MGRGIRRKAMVIAVGAILLAPFVAQAEEKEDARMQGLEDRMRSLEDRLVASEATVQAQRELLASQPTPDVAQGGGLDSFLSGLVWGGWVEASYTYNFKDPDFNRFSQTSYQFNQNHNSFVLDGIKLELGKPASEPGSAGFQFDLLFGENASILENSDIYGDADVEDVTDSEIFIQEAYLAYNYDGVEIKFGKFETLLGYEVLDAPYNPHITHSELFFGAIPLFHTGILASGEIGEEWTWAAGVVNGWNNSIDFNDNKGMLGRVGWANESTSLTFNTFIGKEGLRSSESRGVFSRGDLVCSNGGPGTSIGDPNGLDAGDCFGDSSDWTYVFDLVATYTATDQLDLYGEFVYGMQEIGSQAGLTFPFGATGPSAGVTDDPEWTAVMVGAVYDVNEKTTLALRGEWFNDDGNFRLGHGPLLTGESDHYSATATLGRQLTDNLTARAEYRYDVVNGSSGTDDSVFFNGGGSLSKRQSMGILEVNYTFD